MIIVDDINAMRRHEEDRLCVLAGPDDEELADEASKTLDLTLRHTAPRRGGTPSPSMTTRSA